MAGLDSNPAKRRRKGKNVSPEEKEAERLEAERSAAEAARLEKELFGGTEEDFDAFGQEEREEDTPYEGVLGFEDRRGANGDADEDERAGPRPAWVDDEDEEVTVNIARVNRLRKLRTGEEEAVLTGAQYAERLRAQHVKLNRGTEWAKLETRGKRRLLHEGGWEEEGEEEERGEILREAGDLVVRSRTKLPQTVLEATRMRDANQEEPTKPQRSLCEFLLFAQRGGW